MLDFKTKPVIAMLHLQGDSDKEILEKMVEETEIYYSHGVDAVLVENYFGGVVNCEQALAWLHKNLPDKLYGVNVLGDYRKGFELAEKYNAGFLQIDSVCGHLDPIRDHIYAKELISLMNNRSFQVLGGLRFKYQPIKSGRTFERDAELAKERCHAVVTTGDRTGKDCPTEKLSEFRNALGNFPLIVGAGVTADTVCEKLKFADGVIVGSWLKYGHQVYGGDVCEDYVKEFMNKVIEHRKVMYHEF